MASLTRAAKLRLPPGAAPRPILDLLASRFTYHTAEEWRRELAAGRLQLNGRPTTAPDTPAGPGDWLEYLIPDGLRATEPPVDLAWRRLWEDAALLVAEKPGNLPCHPAGRFFNHTLWAALHDAFPADAFFALANRLDRETSGLVLVAKTTAAARELQRQFSRRQVEKRYLAVVEGAFPEQCEANGWLLPDPASEVRKKRRFIPGAPDAPPAAPGPAEWAETRFRRRRLTPELSLVEAEPRTGRRHQIRATLCSLGFPLVGDKLYGPDDRLYLRFIAGTLTAADRQRLRLPRQALHATRLACRHPATGEPFLATSPLPPELAALLP
ncbi:MAG: pseudouridine synthase [Lentisphaeria bacterium]|jgi:23S rRNA pseudouridine955/2504/2580 synthase/23S rRNA pseudouridine1911/1915/1917 synthase